MDLLIQKAQILLKLSFLPRISILLITRFSLDGLPKGTTEQLSESSREKVVSLNHRLHLQ